MNRLIVRKPLVELWHNGQMIWWCSLAWDSVAEALGKGSDYCYGWTGERPAIIFEGKP